MINEFDKTKNEPKESKINIPKFIFGNEMPDEDFLNLFEKLISYIKDNQPNNCNKIKSFFKKVGLNALFSILDNDNYLTKIKKDIIIQFLFDKGIFDNASDIKIKDSVAILTGIDDKEFSIQKQSLNFPEIDLSNGKKIKLNKELICQFLKSETIISAAKETLNQFKDNKLNSIDEESLKKSAEFFMKNNFYSLIINDKIYAFRIYNGDIFINEKYFDYINSDDKKKVSSLAIILTTLFHEYIHFLDKTISDENNSNNYFLRSKNRPKKKENLILNESGIFFDRLLIGRYHGFYSIEAEFLLNLEKYNVNYKTFCNNFEKHSQKNIDKMDEETFLQRSYVNDDSYLSRGNCLWSLQCQSDEEEN